MPTAASLVADNTSTLLSLSLSQSSLPLLVLSHTHTHTHTHNTHTLEIASEECFPICQRADHERLKITEDDRYRQTDRSEKPCSCSTSTANRFFWWIKILPVTLFPLKSGAKRSGKPCTVPSLWGLITALVCLYGRWRPCQVGDDEVAKV